MVIEAKYENGVFKPIGKIKLKEGTVVEILVNREQASKKGLSIRELGFAGMWADRADIIDGVSYVDSLRDRMINQQIVEDLLQRIPEGASLLDIAQEIGFIASVRQGLEELDRGGRIPIEEVEQDFPHGFSSSPFARLRGPALFLEVFLRSVPRSPVRLKEALQEWGLAAISRNLDSPVPDPYF